MKDQPKNLYDPNLNRKLRKAFELIQLDCLELVYRIVKDGELARDIVNDFHLILLTTPLGEDNITKPKAYIRTSLRNEAVRCNKEQNKKVQFEQFKQIETVEPEDEFYTDCLAGLGNFNEIEIDFEQDWIDKLSKRVKLSMKEKEDPRYLNCKIFELLTNVSTLSEFEKIILYHMRRGTKAGHVCKELNLIPNVYYQKCFRIKDKLYLAAIKLLDLDS